jgi:hypothetical protein
MELIFVGAVGFVGLPSRIQKIFKTPLSSQFYKGSVERSECS